MACVCLPQKSQSLSRLDFLFCMRWKVTRACENLFSVFFLFLFLTSQPNVLSLSCIGCTVFIRFILIRWCDGHVQRTLTTNRMKRDRHKASHSRPHSHTCKYKKSTKWLVFIWMPSAFSPIMEICTIDQNLVFIGLLKWKTKNHSNSTKNGQFR